MPICPITQETIRNVIEITVCGHFFESSAIFRLLMAAPSNAHCPVCRGPFSLLDLYHSRLLQEFIDADRTRDVATQTTAQIIRPDTPQPNLSDDDDDDDMAYPSRYPNTHNGRPSFRNVQPSSVPINPSRTLEFDPTGSVARRNRLFTGIVPIFKFVYNSPLTIVNAAETLSLSGYLVYDIFHLNRISPINGMYNYVIYSASIRHDGSPVPLCIKN